MAKTDVTSLTVVHNRGGDVLAGGSLRPGSLDVQIQPGLAAHASVIFLHEQQRLPHPAVKAV